MQTVRDWGKYLMPHLELDFVHLGGLVSKLEILELDGFSVVHFLAAF